MRPPFAREPLLLAASLATAACSPLAGFRPASGIPDGRSAEVGGGAVLVSPRPYVEEPVRAAGQLWASARPGRRLTVSGIGAFDLEAIALGGALRVDVLRSDRLVLGGEGELGFVWAGASAPVALRVFGKTWLYTAPRLGTLGEKWAVELPAGLDVRFADTFAVRLEYRVSWAELDPFQRRHHGGLALAWFL